MEINTLFSITKTLQNTLQSNPKGEQKTCSSTRVLTEELKKLSYSKGAIFIPRGKEGRLACVTKFAGKKLSKIWLSTIKPKLKKNMKKGMSKEKAFYRAIVDTLREGKFKYYKHEAPEMSVIPPSEFLRVKIGDCTEYAILVAATAKAFNLDYIYIYNYNHIISAIVIKEGDRQPADLKPLKIEVSERLGAPPTTLNIYPIEVSPAPPAPASGDLKKALSGAYKWIQARNYRTELEFVNSSGKILKHRSQWEEQVKDYVYPIFSIDILPNLQIDPPLLSTPAVEKGAPSLKLTVDLPPSLSGDEKWMTPVMRMHLWKHGAGAEAQD